MRIFNVAEMENLFYWLRACECKYEMYFVDSSTIAIRRDSNSEWVFKRITELVVEMHNYIDKEIATMND